MTSNRASRSASRVSASKGRLARFGVRMRPGACAAYARLEPNPGPIAQGMRSILVAPLMIGLASTMATHAVADEDLENRIEKVLDWHLGASMTIWFLSLAFLVRRWRGSPAAG